MDKTNDQCCERVLKQSSSVCSDRFGQKSRNNIRYLQNRIHPDKFSNPLSKPRISCGASSQPDFGISTRHHRFPWIIFAGWKINSKENRFVSRVQGRTLNGVGTWMQCDCQGKWSNKFISLFPFVTGFWKGVAQPVRHVMGVEKDRHNGVTLAVASSPL